MLGDPRNPNSLSVKFRRKRDVRLRELIAAVAQGRPGVQILDMGGTVEYWERIGVDFLREQRAFVTILNLRPTELSDAPYPDVITTAVGNACDLPQYADGQFDLVHSNSVIEHVETWSNMKAFARETRRLGAAYYVQTPYFWCPIDPHYYRMPLFHWFPRPIRARLLNAFPIAATGKRIAGVDNAFSIVDGARLLDGRQFRFLFPEAEMSFERVLALPKSMVAIHKGSAAAGAAGRG